MVIYRNLVAKIKLNSACFQQLMIYIYLTIACARALLQREAAVKKKQESFSYISNENPEIATSFGGSVTLPPQAEQQVSG